MLIQTCFTAAVLMGLAASGTFPGRPDLSGEWILNRRASTLSPGADAVQSSVWRIEHRDPKFSVKATAVSATGPIEFQFELSTEQSASVLRWEGETLVANMRVPLPEGELNISFRYELLDGGRRLRAIETLRGGGRDQDNTWIFDRG